MLSIRAAKLSNVSVAVGIDGAAAATVASASCFRAAASVTLLSAIIAAATDATATDWAVTCSSSGLPLYEAPATRAIQPGWTGIIIIIIIHAGNSRTHLRHFADPARFQPQAHCPVFQCAFLERFYCLADLQCGHLGRG